MLSHHLVLSRLAWTGVNISVNVQICHFYTIAVGRTGQFLSCTGYCNVSRTGQVSNTRSLIYGKLCLQFMRIFILYTGCHYIQLTLRSLIFSLFPKWCKLGPRDSGHIIWEMDIGTWRWGDSMSIIFEIDVNIESPSVHYLGNGQKYIETGSPP